MKIMGLNDLFTVLLFALSPLVLIGVIYLAGCVTQTEKTSKNTAAENKQVETALSPAD
jgi:hypothetical protein